ncbi:MAG: hypothetical protein J2P54_10315 [Bradyrhizobiaceae bacterium]|nr:hypothetical protein [Bradyrhizobiaceae bacterium]
MESNFVSRKLRTLLGLAECLDAFLKRLVIGAQLPLAARAEQGRTAVAVVNLT